MWSAKAAYVVGLRRGEVGSSIHGAESTLRGHRGEYRLPLFELYFCRVGQECFWKETEV